MEIARIFFFIALYSLVACWLCNIMTLFSRPHKWSELLIFPQLVWCALGIVGVEYFNPQTEVQWCLVIYGYPILLLPIQLFAYHQFLLLYVAVDYFGLCIHLFSSIIIMIQHPEKYRGKSSALFFDDF